MSMTITRLSQEKQNKEMNMATLLIGSMLLSITSAALLSGRAENRRIDFFVGITQPAN